MAFLWIDRSTRYCTVRGRNIYCGVLLPEVKLTKLERPGLHQDDFQNFAFQNFRPIKIKESLD